MLFGSVFAHSRGMFSPSLLVPFAGARGMFSSSLWVQFAVSHVGGMFSPSLCRARLRPSPPARRCTTCSRAPSTSAATMQTSRARPRTMRMPPPLLFFWRKQGEFQVYGCPYILSAEFSAGTSRGWPIKWRVWAIFCTERGRLSHRPFALLFLQKHSFSRIIRSESD
jgi:hypothetical protein